MIQMIATDMDGTFLDSQKQFSMDFFDVFEKLTERNIKFVLASGNQYYRLYQKFLPLSEKMYFIAENGSLIAEGPKILSCNIIAVQTVAAIQRRLEEIQRLVAIFCGKKSAYILKKYQVPYEAEVKKYYCRYTFIDRYEEIDDDIIKIALLDPQYQIHTLKKEITAILPDDVKVVTSGNEWMDIQNRDVHKGVGMRFLQERYQIKPEQCAAFGDQMNDYELLSQVKYSYAMSNAVPEIKQIAYEVIGSNDEQAVITKIKEILANE